MDETDFLDRTRRVAEAFRPSAPIDRRDLFAGRAEQIAELFSIVSQPGQHAIVYGERGVGKTSLALVAAELLRAANVLTAWATCDASDDFSSVWRKALGEIVFATSSRPIGFAERVDETVEPLSTLLGPGSVTPHAIQRALRDAGRERAIAVFVDEFDRFQDKEGRVLFADSIKALSDRVVSSTVVLVGVADSVGELIREHRSVERALVQTPLPRMSASELAQIATTGIAAPGCAASSWPCNRSTAVTAARCSRTRPTGSTCQRLPVRASASSPRRRRSSCSTRSTPTPRTRAEEEKTPVHSDRSLWATAVFAGLRRGELQALRVSDLHGLDGESTAYLSVEHGWDAVAGRKDPKSRGRGCARSRCRRRSARPSLTTSRRRDARARNSLRADGVGGLHALAHPQASAQGVGGREREAGRGGVAAPRDGHAA